MQQIETNKFIRDQVWTFGARSVVIQIIQIVQMEPKRKKEKKMAIAISLNIK